MFKKSIFLLTLSLIGSLLRSNTSDCTYVGAEYEKLVMMAQRYTDFLAAFGKADTEDLIPLMVSIFAPDCHKIVNGKIVSKTISELYSQMTDAKNSVGLWTVTVASPFVLSPYANTIAAYYEIPTERHGTHLVMKFLILDTSGLIKEINEVFNLKD